MKPRNVDASSKKPFAKCHLGRILSDHGITQTAFSFESGLAQPYVNRVVAGSAMPQIPNLLHILAALERLTGLRFDVRQVWEPSRARRYRRYDIEKRVAA